MSDYFEMAATMRPRSARAVLVAFWAWLIRRAFEHSGLIWAPEDLEQLDERELGEASGG